MHLINFKVDQKKGWLDMIDPENLKVIMIITIFVSLMFALLFHFFDLEEADE